MQCLVSSTTSKQGVLVFLGFCLVRSCTVCFGRAFWADEAAKLGTKFLLKSKLQAHALV